MTYVAATDTAVATTVATVVAPHPAGLQAGDLLLACAWNNNSTGTHSATGWTVANNATGTSAMWKVADAADVTAGSTTFNRLTNQTNAGGVILVAYRSLGAVAAAAASANTSGVSTTLALTGVTAAQANTTLVQIVTKAASGTSWTPPGTATSRFTGSTTGTVTLYAGGDEIVAAGATGTRTWSRGVGDTGASRGAMFAVNPASATGAGFLLLI